MDEELEKLFAIENDLIMKMDAQYDDFLVLDYIFHWKGNFNTGLKNLRENAKIVSKSKSKNKEVILKIHKNVRFYFYGLLQIPYILDDHFQKQNQIKTNPTLNKIYKRFLDKDANQLLLAIRHKVVHAILLDEYVTIVKPVSAKHYLEITLPHRTLQTLTTPNKRGKSILGTSGKFFERTFIGTSKGFIHLFTQFENDLKEFEQDFKKEFTKIYKNKFAEKRNLKIKLSNVKSKMKKQGIIFVTE